MTAVKQTSVKSARHLKRLESYLDWERDKALDHDSLNLAAGDCGGMFREMDSTREAYGHNRPGKAGARCTYMQHQILAFNPDECDLNGGPMTPARCMAYAREYVESRYPDQEALWVLHRERCASDGTDRYAVHVALNRTNLATGRRLDEGPARRAAAARAKTVRELDARHGLAQLERGKNSKVHARQPSRAEREWQRRDRSRRSENDRVRERVAVRACEVAAMPSCQNRPRELARRLRDDGIEMTRSARGDLQYRFRSESLRLSGGGEVPEGERCDPREGRQPGRPLDGPRPGGHEARPLSRAEGGPRDRPLHGGRRARALIRAPGSLAGRSATGGLPPRGSES